MINTGKLAGKTIFITGASRGIGKAIALKAAKDGANIVIAAKTTQPHPKLPGTIYTAAKEVEDAGGRCLPCIVDIREEAQVAQAVDGAVKQFGGIDILVNNASAINLTSTLDTDMKRYDLMHSINTRGTFLTSKYCIPHLKKAQNPHILNLSPPLVMTPRWFKDHVAYTMAKYGMSMCVLGMAAELKEDGIAVNALWPRTAIATAAMEMLGGKEIGKNCRTADILADAAYAILSKDSRSFTGNFCIDDKVLMDAGVTNMEQYSVAPGNPLLTDFFLSDEDVAGAPSGQMLIGSMPPPSKEEPSAGGGAATGGDIESIFMKLKAFLSQDLVKQVQCVYLFQVKDDRAGPFYIDLKNGAGSVAKGQPSDKADVTFTTDEETYKKLFDGSLKAANAFMSGKLRMKGDMGKALKLDKLMGKLKSKL